MSDVYDDSKDRIPIIGVCLKGEMLEIVNHSLRGLEISESISTPYTLRSNYTIQRRVGIIAGGEKRTLKFLPRHSLILHWMVSSPLNFVIENVADAFHFISSDDIVSENRETNPPSINPTICDTVSGVIKDNRYKETLQSNKENLELLSEKIDELNRGLKKELNESVRELRESISSLSSKEFFEQIRHLDMLISNLILSQVHEDKTWSEVYDTLSDIRRKMVLAYGVRGVEEYCPSAGDAYNPLDHDVDGDVPDDYVNFIVNSCLYSGFKDKENQIILHPIVTIRRRGLY